MRTRLAPEALLLVGLAVLLAPGTGALPITRAEIFFLDAARHMVESGDWLVPRYQGEPFFDKPVLAYWAMAAAFRLLGTEPGVARLVSVLAALGLVAATLWLGRLLFDRRTSLAGGACLATTFTVLSFGRIAMADMLLALLTTLCAGLGARGAGPSPPRWVLPALGAVLGLGFLAKGPIALVVGGSSLLALAAAGRRWPAVAPRSAALALGAFAATGLSWFALVAWHMGPAPLARLFLRENLSRFADATYALGQPPWFYATAYLAGGLPWSLYLPLALWRLRSEPDPRARSGTRALVLWAGLVLLLLTLSRGKLDYYLLPLYPAASLLVGRHFAAVTWRGLDAAWARVVLLLAAAACAAAALHPPAVPDPWLPGPGARAALVAALAGGAILLVGAARHPRPGYAAAALGGSVSAVALVLTAFFLPAFSRAQPGRSITEAVARERAARPGLAVVVCADPARVRRDLLFHARVPVLPRCNLAERAAEPEALLFLVSPEEDAQLRGLPGYRPIASYFYLSAAITPSWLLRGPQPGELRLVANFGDAAPSGGPR